MPKINFVKSLSSIKVKPKANLMQALLTAKIPIASSCGGDAVCAKCVVKVIKGEKNLSKIEPLEAQRIKLSNISEGWRLSCQSKVLADVTIDTNYW